MREKCVPDMTGNKDNKQVKRIYVPRHLMFVF